MFCAHCLGYIEPQYFHLVAYLSESLLNRRRGKGSVPRLGSANSSHVFHARTKCSHVPISSIILVQNKQNHENNVTRPHHHLIMAEAQPFFKPFYHYASSLNTSKRLSLSALSHYRSTLCKIRSLSIMLFLSHSFLPRPSPQKRSLCPLMCIISSPTLFFLFHGYQ